MGKNFDPSGVRGHRLVAVDEIISPFNSSCLNCSKPTKRYVASPASPWFKILDPPAHPFLSDRSGAPKLRAYLQAKGVGSRKKLPKFSGVTGQLLPNCNVSERSPGKPRPCAELQRKFDKIRISRRKEDAHPPLKFR